MLKPGPVGVGDVLHLGDGGDDPMGDNEKDGKNHTNEATAKRSNVTPIPDVSSSSTTAASNVRSTVRKSMQLRSSMLPSNSSKRKPSFHRTKSDVDEVTSSLYRATIDTVFDHKVFHRHASGELRERSSEAHKEHYRTDVVPAPPMVPDEETKLNLGKVHYHLACLHGMNRFAEGEKIEKRKTNSSKNNNNLTEGHGCDDNPDGNTDDDEEEGPDAAAIVFHLSHASSLRCATACLALGRVRAGLGSCISPCLQTVIPVDFDSAKGLLQRAMEKPIGSTTTNNRSNSDVKTRAAAGCLLLQILQEEETTTLVTLHNFMEETLDLVQQARQEEKELQAHEERLKRVGGAQDFHVGDRVEGNYCMEGTFYPGVLTAIDKNNSEDVMLTVQYDDDGSSETLVRSAVRPLIPATATRQTSTRSTDAGGGLSDLEALGLINEDEHCLLDVYTLQADLAEIKAKLGHAQEAAALYESAAEGALEAGKMKTASEYSLKASELC